MNGGLDGEKDFFLGGMWMWVWMRAYQQWRRREEKGEGEMRGKDKREENWMQAVLPNGASYRAAQLHCHCIALATLLEERCGRALPSMVLRGSSHSLQNLPSRQTIVTRPPKRLIMDDGGECKHAHLRKRVLIVWEWKRE